jgi:DNA-binding GntR family transcriptional regulator
MRAMMVVQNRMLETGTYEFAEIEAVSLTDRVIEALKFAFFSGKLKPGDPIVERLIARKMNVGTPVVREALISLTHAGFVRRIKNKGSFVTRYEAEEIRQLYLLRIELETLALQWARPRLTASDLDKLQLLVDNLVQAGRDGDRQKFLESDYEFHRACWNYSGNAVLAETLNRLMSPLFAFVVVASDKPLTEAMGREHYAIVDALRSMSEPDFTSAIRKCLTGFAFRWMAEAPHLHAVSTERQAGSDRGVRNGQSLR